MLLKTTNALIDSQSAAVVMNHMICDLQLLWHSKTHSDHVYSPHKHTPCANKMQLSTKSVTPLPHTAGNVKINWVKCVLAQNHQTYILFYLCIYFCLS